MFILTKALLTIPFHVRNVTDDIQSIANDYAKGADLNEIKSTIENKAGDLLSESPVRI